jgi:hypothetical protein
MYLLFVTTTVLLLVGFIAFVLTDKRPGPNQVNQTKQGDAMAFDVQLGWYTAIGIVLLTVFALF